MTAIRPAIQDDLRRWHGADPRAVFAGWNPLVGKNRDRRNAQNRRHAQQRLLGRALGKYVLFTRQAPNHERTVFRSESSDFIHWSAQTQAIHALPEEGKKRQAYCMPVYPYGDGYVGLVMMYNAGTDQTVDCELAWRGFDFVEASLSRKAVHPAAPPEAMTRDV